MLKSGFKNIKICAIPAFQKQRHLSWGKIFFKRTLRRLRVSRLYRPLRCDLVVPGQRRFKNRRVPGKRLAKSNNSLRDACPQTTEDCNYAVQRKKWMQRPSQSNSTAPQSPHMTEHSLSGRFLSFCFFSDCSPVRSLLLLLW